LYLELFKKKMGRVRLYDIRVMNRLILKRNVSVAASSELLTTNEKRKLFSMLRRLKPAHLNYLFPGALTIGEFATAAIMQSDLARRKRHLPAPHDRSSDEDSQSTDDLVT
jgi:hypothetical protein